MVSQLSYHRITPGSIPGVGMNFGLPVDQADIVMNDQLIWFRLGEGAMANHHRILMPENWVPYDLARSGHQRSLTAKMNLDELYFPFCWSFVENIMNYMMSAAQIFPYICN